jgi:hypothetical protein
VADAILDAVAKECPQMSIRRAVTFGEYAGVDAPGPLRPWTPDAFLTEEREGRRKREWVFEFQRGWTDHDEEDTWRADAKTNKYHPLVCTLEHRGQEEVEVFSAVFILGVLGSYREHDWAEMLTEMGVTPAGVERVCKAALPALTKANGGVLTARQERRFAMAKF